jgi:alpha-beta hydrolase superfamily lysophospholipase
MVEPISRNTSFFADLASESTLSTFVASDGDNIAVQDWPLAFGQTLRGVVILVHGLGEHAGRYDHVARHLNGWGFAVRGYDQHGHGESGGVRGALPTDRRLLVDLADVVRSTRLRMDRGTPLILLGHSMGGLVAARFVSLKGRAVQGLVLSSPALDAGLSRGQKLMAAVLAKVTPGLRVGNGLNVAALSHDLETVLDYQTDPLVHDRISARLARFIAQAGPATVAAAPTWKVPTLLMYAGDDKLVNPAGSRAFAAAAPRDVVTAQCFDRMYHEIFNEPDADRVFEALKAWLDARFSR